MSDFQKGIAIGVVLGIFVWPMVRGALAGFRSTTPKDVG